MKIETVIPDQDIFDACLSADIGYWCDRRLSNFAYEAKMPKWCLYVPDREDKLVKVNEEGIKRAVQIMAVKHAHHFADLVTGTGDATTGDVLVQLAAFGEIVYG